jgi:hypothetical protein
MSGVETATAIPKWSKYHHGNCVESAQVGVSYQQTACYHSYQKFDITSLEFCCRLLFHNGAETGPSTWAN